MAIINLSEGSFARFCLSLQRQCFELRINEFSGVFSALAKTDFCTPLGFARERTCTQSLLLCMLQSRHLS